MERENRFGKKYFVAYCVIHEVKHFILRKKRKPPPMDKGMENKIWGKRVMHMENHMINRCGK